MINYWYECVSEALEDAGIDAAEDQVHTVADWVEGAHENYGMYSGNDVADKNWHDDYNDKINKANKERDEIELNTRLDADKKIKELTERYENLVFNLRMEIDRLRCAK